MAGNYWTSSQRAHWQFSRQQLDSFRYKITRWESQKLANSPISIRYDTNMRIFIHQCVIKLGRKLSLRQIVLATAEVYISRFLTRVSLLEVNVYMLVTTCIYIACKISENPQHIRTVLNEARICWPDFITSDFTRLAEFEFYVIEELDCYLIIHHPYDALSQLVDVLGAKNGANNNNYRLDLTKEEVESTWQVINDSYITDLPLLYPPHIVAVAALCLTLVLSTDVPAQPGSLPTLFISSSKSKNKNIIKIKNPSSTTTKPKSVVMSTSTNATTTANTNKAGTATGAGAAPGAGRRKLSQLRKQPHLPPLQHTSSTSRPTIFSSFLAGSNINIPEVVEATQELLSLYDHWDSYYDEGAVRVSLRTLLVALQSV